MSHYTDEPARGSSKAFFARHPVKKRNQEKGKTITRIDLRGNGSCNGIPVAVAIVNGTCLIYAWDSVRSQRGPTTKQERANGRWKRERRRGRGTGERGLETGCLLNIIFSARGNFHFFVRRLPSPTFQEDRRKTAGGRAPLPLLRESGCARRNASLLVLSFVKPDATISAF